jgi:hypothetical protein
MNQHPRYTFLIIGAMLIIPASLNAQETAETAPLRDPVREAPLKTLLQERGDTTKETEMRRLETKKIEEEKRRLNTEQIAPLRTGSTTPAERATILETRKADRAQMQEIRRVELSERALERVTFYSTRVVGRLLAAIERIEALANRIETRRAIVETSGADTETVSSALGKARAALARAHEEIDYIQSIERTVDPKEKAALVREAVKSAHEHIRISHEAIGEALRALKGLSLNTRPETAE